ncbi:MAG: hypothetical protein OJF49_004745 [Ktedonobacterales bacterium]|jgi:hypothetical protein|nr:MAG: hypothetical protein OJF49_004745 [Ktedonobacterales bacterium]
MRNEQDERDERNQQRERSGRAQAKGKPPRHRATWRDLYKSEYSRVAPVLAKREVLPWMEQIAREAAEMAYAVTLRALLLSRQGPSTKRISVVNLMLHRYTPPKAGPRGWAEPSVELEALEAGDEWSDFSDFTFILDMVKISDKDQKLFVSMQGPRLRAP